MSKEEKTYIENVKYALNSSADPIEIVHKLEHIKYTKNIGLHMLAIRAEIGDLEFEQRTSLDMYEGQELDEHSLPVAERIIKAVKKHIENYETGKQYVKKYIIRVWYDGFWEGWNKTRSIVYDIEAKSDDEAVEISKTWKEKVPSTTTEYYDGKSFDKPAKLVKIIAEYVVHDNEGNKVVGMEDWFPPGFDITGKNW